VGPYGATEAGTQDRLPRRGVSLGSTPHGALHTRPRLRQERCQKFFKNLPLLCAMKNRKYLQSHSVIELIKVNVNRAQGTAD
jgi:hypothetical protein